MGNVVETIEREFGGPVVVQEEAEDHEVDTVIDLDSDNWREKVQEYKENWYARRTNGEDIGKTERRLSFKQGSDEKRLHVLLKPSDPENVDSKPNGVRKQVKDQEKTRFQKESETLLEEQERKTLQRRQELTERSAKSHERVEGFRRKYKLCDRDYSGRCNTAELTDERREKEDRGKCKKLRHHIRAKYQLPVGDQHTRRIAVGS